VADPRDELPLRDARVSRRHAEVLWNGRFLVRDCRSRNGTLLRNLRVDGELRAKLDALAERGLAKALVLLTPAAPAGRPTATTP
jgi:pSer/pThr/pTyr-binding forkhead associated (FHA) protein